MLGHDCEMIPFRDPEIEQVVLASLRAGGSEVPALIVSAHQNPGDADAPTDLEIEAYVTKPIDFERLLETITELTA